MITEQALEEAGTVGEGGEDVRRDVQSASASNGGNVGSDGKNQQ